MVNRLTFLSFSLLLFGRTDDVDKISRLLDRPDCRLLTLIGVGGIGKTRLAAQIMTQQAAAGYDVAFVDLQPVQSAALLASSIADALHLPRKRPG